MNNFFIKATNKYEIINLFNKVKMNNANGRNSLNTLNMQV